MAFITEITVNMPSVPPLLNRVCHLLFFLFSLIYTIKYFEYALSLTKLNKDITTYLTLAYFVSGTFFVITLTSDIEYVHGEITSYSSGIGPTLCYAFGFFLFILADIIIILERKVIEKHVLYSILPLSFLTLGFIILQIFIPQFLFTGPALTLSALGLFFAVENPIQKLQKRALIDYNTQTWNRNCYEDDIENELRQRLASSNSFIYVLGDINGLKVTNDTLGHLAGDKLIIECAKIMTEFFQNAYKIYRIGGDEFAIMYFSVPAEIVRKEVETVSEKIKQLQFSPELSVSMSFGIAEKQGDDTINDVMQKADSNMYEAKKAYYSAKAATEAQ
ncbi:MAG: GGDEF domain-containing protein [Clostridia bacterium]|nr:GGDEF domain-containing protein [Clostridia bacterium]